MVNDVKLSLISQMTPFEIFGRALDIPSKHNTRINQTSKVEFFAEIVNRVKPVNYFRQKPLS